MSQTEAPQSPMHFNRKRKPHATAAAITIAVHDPYAIDHALDAGKKSKAAAIDADTQQSLRDALDARDKENITNASHHLSSHAAGFIASAVPRKAVHHGHCVGTPLMKERRSEGSFVHADESFESLPSDASDANDHLLETASEGSAQHDKYSHCEDVLDGIDNDDEQTQEQSDNQDSEQETEFDPYEFMKTLPPIPEEYARRSPTIAAQKPTDGRPTLVLDLDETLVHCSTDEMEDYDLTFSVVFSNQEYLVYAKIRPYCDYFLKQASKYFEIVVFTASQRAYADKILDILDPDQLYIQHRAFRDSCVYVHGNYVKDLNILGRSLSKVLLVDNSPHAFGYQIDNGVPIESWYGDYEDEELLMLLPFLLSLSKAKDVRPHIRERFKSFELVFGSSKPPAHLCPDFDVDAYFERDDDDDVYYEPEQ